MTTANDRYVPSAAAQAAYGEFGPTIATDLASLAEEGKGDFTNVSAARFLGLTQSSAPFTTGGLFRTAYEPEQPNGFSASVFQELNSGRKILAVRGTADLADFLQDAKLGLVGFVSDQAISLYRYYRRLTTPAGQAVQYSEQERSLLQALNIPFPGGLAQLGSFITGPILNAQLDGDVGVTPVGGGSGSVLQPGEMITVTGHSLGGHLALLFGRLFPLVTEHVYTFNAPGVLPQGDFTLTNAGAPVFDPSRVTNIVANYGADLTAAIGTRPGVTHRVFNELRAGNATHNHSIVQLSDSLALYDLFGALSPALADRIDSISAILAASSARPEESLERALDMLRLAIMDDHERTPIAVANGDQAQRDAFYTRLYELRDAQSGAEWSIESLVGRSASELAGLAEEDSAYLFALTELMPFAVLDESVGVPLPGGDSPPPPPPGGNPPPPPSGGPPPPPPGGGGDGGSSTPPPDAGAPTPSSHWLDARAGFLTRLLEGRTLDQPFVASRNAKSVLFVDIDRGEKLAALAAQDWALAEGVKFSPQNLASHLESVSYSGKNIFGSWNGADTLDGSAGADRLFGGGGADVLRGLAGADLLEGGLGADTLEGGDGYDVYSFQQLEAGDRIADSDGKGRIEIGSASLGDGYLTDDGRYATGDGAHVYALAGDVLTVDGLLEIHGYASGELGIRLVDEPDDGEAPTGLSTSYIGDLEVIGSTPPEEVAAGYGNFPRGATARPAEPDAFAGAPGNTFIQTLDGDDTVAEDWGGDDLILLGDGWDAAFGGPGADWIQGGAGLDLLIGGRGDDVLYTEGPDNPLLIATSARGDQASGGQGDDVLIGSGGADFLEGGADADRLLGGAGDDFLYGDGGLVDTFVHERHDEEILSGPHQGVLVDIVDVLRNLTSTRSALALTSSTDEHAPGVAAYVDVDGGQADEIFAGPGDDVLYAGSGNDTLHGEDGHDRLFGQDGDDFLFGGAGNDILRGGAGADTLDGGGGQDVLHAGAGDIVLLGHGRSGVVRFENEPATVTLRVEDTNDVFILGTTVVAGGSGSVFLDAGANALAGLRFEFDDGTQSTFAELAIRSAIEASSSILLPRGGSGDDTYTFKTGDGRDTIYDQAGTDTLVMQGVASADAAVFSAGSDMLLRYPGGEVRLVAQAINGFGVDNVRFTDTAWTRSQLAAAAQALPPVDPIGMAAATAGEPFAYAVTQGAFGEQHILGTPQIEVGTLNGTPLPAWLSFDSGSGTLSGTPSAADAGLVPVFVALRDAADVVAVAPLVIAVAEATAAAQSAAESSVSEAATPAVEEAIVDLPTLIPSTASAAGKFSESTVVDLAAPSSGPAIPERQSVGQIDDPVYERVESLLSAPAAAHASSFVERYAEAIREFNERSRQSDPDAAPPPPPPTDEEMAAYNEALHSWLDADRARLAAAPSEESWDFGGWAGPFAASPGNPGGGVAVADQALARPGLPQPRAIHAAPGLAEGMGNLTL